MRVHVGVDQAGHQHAALQVDHAGGVADVLPHAFVVTDIGNAAGAHRDGLVHAVLRIDGVDIAVAVHGVGRRRRQDSGRQEGGDQGDGPAGSHV
jgi:hypothetical protein